MRKIYLLLLGMFALGVDAYVMAGILPSIAEDFGVSIGASGQTVSVFTLCYAIAAPVFATLMSKTNAKYTLVTALSIFTFANFITAITHQFVILLISRGIAGIGAGLYSPLASSAAVSLVEEKQRGRALSTILLGMSAGTVIGVPLGIYISSIFEWRMTMWFIVMIGAVGIVALLCKFPVVKSNSLPTLRERLGMFKNRDISLVMTITMILSFCSLGLYTYLDLIIGAYGFKKSIVFIWMWGIGGIAGSFIIGYLMDFYKRPRVILMYLLILMLISFILMGSVHYLAVIFAIVLMLWGASGWASLATLQKTLVEISPEHATISIALLSSINYLAGSIGTMTNGILLEQGMTPMTLPYLTGGIVVIAMGLQWILIARKL
ncbi:MFS transporter [Brevibacillus laterosporus]|uniref:MFS transporter n=1 Tax=Brevibacillus laterosporus TaxID=1465 RepID=A0AAP8QBB0_BRELA|nr:MFS transporter [Brevibacillus laterosporus]MED1662788.1 MFS transporter [Brevibacillus laterosporus]MED1669086.1 MFS transporter [Brevibacillus laterosporus]MED1720561.1 MFS transporter [Brevibacillus laterosporus]PPA88369.1 MFS transporter [Brevibacillus laterosporus]PPA93910.1 MFS transporter [Brevibacillus laterosporus]